MIEHLLDLAGEVGLEVRAVPASAVGTGRGGEVVTLRGRQVVFLDPQAAPAEQIRLLGGVLRSSGLLSDRYLRPEVREAIDGQDAFG